MPPCLEDLHGYTVVVVKGGQNRYFHSLYLRKQAKMPFSNCSKDRGRETRQFFRASFYRSTKIRFSLILPLRESCWGVPSPNPAYAACAAEKSLKIIFRIFQKQFRFTPCFSPISERTPRTAERRFYHAKTI